MRWIPTIRGRRFSSGVIRQIQRGTISLSAAQTSNTATVLGYSLTDSVLHFTYKSDANTLQYSQVKIVKTNTTTITASRIAASEAIVVSWYLETYVEGIVLVQPYSVSMAHTVASGTATLTYYVNPDRHVIVGNGRTNDNTTSANWSDSITTDEMTSGDGVTVTVTRGTTSFSVGLQVSVGQVVLYF